MNKITFNSKLNLFISDKIPSDFPNGLNSFISELTLSDGTLLKATEVDFSSRRIDICKITGKAFPVGSRALLMGTVECEEDCEVFLGAGADWWWSGWVNGKKVIDRSKSADVGGNYYATASKVDWIIPVSLRKGSNLLAFVVDSGYHFIMGCDVFEKELFPDYFNPMAITNESLSGYRLVGNTTRDPVSYKVGEDIEFVFELSDSRSLRDEGIYLKWIAIGDDGEYKTGLSRISETEPLSVVTRLSRPGFVRVMALLCNSRGETAGPDQLLLEKGWRFEGGAGADVDKLKPSVEEPADFVEYWTKQRNELAEVPVKADVSPYLGNVFPDGTRILPEVDMFLVSVDCLGPRPVTGFLSVPKAEGVYPAKVAFCGYGGLDLPHVAHTCQSKDEIVFHVNAHGYELHRGRNYYKDFAANITKKHTNYAFSEEENSNPDTAYFKGMVLRVLRSIDFVKTLPKWNRKSIIAFGGSQGGLQAIWAAGLHPDVTRCESSVTWCCNMAGYSVDDRIPGWCPAYVPGLNYFDPVFHAAHIPEKCFVCIPRAGLGDYVCPPSGVTAMFNQLKCPKSIAYFQNSTHSFIPSEASIFRHR